MIEEGENLGAICSISEDEFKCLTKLNEQIQGNTEKQKNPFLEGTVSWTVWIFARLGGWMGYGSQRKPGATTLIRGMHKFYQIYKGYALNIDVCTR